MCVLSVTASLLDMLVHSFDGHRNGFPECNCRLANFHRNLELGTKAVNHNLKVQLAHTRNYRFLGFLVVLCVERRVFVNQAPKSLAQLVLVLLVGRLNLELDYWLGDMYRFKVKREFLVAKGVAGLCVFHADQCNYFASTSLGNFLTFLSLDAENTTNAFGLALRRVVNRHSACELARKDSDESLLTYIGVVYELECQSRELFAVERLAAVCLFTVVQVGADNSANINRRRQIIDNCVE